MFLIYLGERSCKQFPVNFFMCLMCVSIIKSVIKTYRGACGAQLVSYFLLGKVFVLNERLYYIAFEFCIIIRHYEGTG